MKTFKFHAKQGQEQQIVELIQNQFNLIVALIPSSEGVIVKAELPMGVSKRQMNKFLELNNVPGATSKSNKMVVTQEDCPWTLMRKIGQDVPFIFVSRVGKKRKLLKAKVIQTVFCECCGPMFQLVTKKHSPKDW